VTDAAALRRSLPLTVIGKLHRVCQHPNSMSNKLIRSLLAPSGALLTPQLSPPSVKHSRFQWACGFAFGTMSFP